MMSFRRIFELSFCLFFVKYSLTGVIVIDYNEELERVFTELNISSPTSKEDLFARKLVDERIAKEKERADRAEWSLTEANYKIGALHSEIETLQKVRIRLSPRTLVDSVQETYELEYYEVMETYRRALEQLRKEQTDLPSKITNLENELQNPNLDDKKKNAKKDQSLRHTSRLKKIPEEIEKY